MQAKIVFASTRKIKEPKELSARFWKAEQNKLEALLSKELRKITQRSSLDTLSDLSNEDQDILTKVSIKPLSKSLTRWIDQQSKLLAAQLIDTTQQGVQKVAKQFKTQGKSPKTLAELLDPLFGEQRAALIAATETTRALNQGKALTWDNIGITSAIWLTAEDERVCPYCEPLDGKEVELTALPPEHPRCRCTSKPVIPGVNE